MWWLVIIRYSTQSKQKFKLLLPYYALWQYFSSYGHYQYRYYNHFSCYHSSVTQEVDIFSLFAFVTLLIISTLKEIEDSSELHKSIFFSV